MPDLTTVVLERVVQVHGGGRLPVADRAVDGRALLDRLLSVSADGAVQADRAGLVLQAAHLS